MGRLHARLIEQCPLEGPLARGQGHHAVVQGREDVKAERGREALRAVHQRASSSGIAPETRVARRESAKYRNTITLSTPAKKHHTEMNQVA